VFEGRFDANWLGDRWFIRREVHIFQIVLAHMGRVGIIAGTALLFKVHAPFQTPRYHWGNGVVLGEYEMARAPEEVGRCRVAEGHF
jgi:hypothetical protein